VREFSPLRDEGYCTTKERSDGKPCTMPTSQASTDFILMIFKLRCSNALCRVKRKPWKAGTSRLSSRKENDFSR
jgi:hypothetical protein